MTREEGLRLVREYISNEALIQHLLSVEAAMRHYARLNDADIEQWGLTGLLHDFDYERWPDPRDHTREGAKALRELGVDDEIVGAILSHAHWNLDEYPRDTPLRKTLFAVDELCGFIYACALVRPERLVGLTPKSVKKKLKTKAFAAAVSREDVHSGAELLGLPLDDHISNCVAAMQAVQNELGLTPPAKSQG